MRREASRPALLAPAVRPEALEAGALPADEDAGIVGVRAPAPAPLAAFFAAGAEGPVGAEAFDADAMPEGLIGFRSLAPGRGTSITRRYGL